MDSEHVLDYAAYRREKEPYRPGLAFAVAVVLATVVMIMFLSVVFVVTEARKNEVAVPPEAIIDEVTRIVTQYNQGLAHGNPKSVPSDATLMRAFCFFALVSAILYYAYANRPRLIDALAVGLVVGLVVVFVVVSNAESRCEIRDIVNDPYKTGTLCACKGAQSISLRALFEHNVSVATGVTELGRVDELCRVVQRLATLTVETLVLKA